jgi:hypothetical protein
MWLKARITQTWMLISWALLIMLVAMTTAHSTPVNQHHAVPGGLLIEVSGCNG